MKKTLFVIAGIALISSMVLIGCDKGSGGGKSGNYPIELSVFVGGGVRPEPSNTMYQWIKEKFNVTFSWDILVGDLYQRRGTMVAGGVFPDILEINETFFIDEGAVIPLDDLIEKHAPNLKKHYANIWDQMKHTDGKVYCLVNYGVIHGVEQGAFYNGSAFWVQKDVLKDAGYPQVATLDQFFTMIENYYRKYPTIDGAPTIPFTVITEDWRAFELWNPPNFLAGNPNEGNGIVNPTTFEYKNFFTDDISKRWFKYFNELDKRGLVDREAFTQSYDQYTQKIAQGRVLALFGQQWQFGGEEDAKATRGANNRTMAPLPIVFDSSIKPRYRTETTPNLGRGIGISVSAKDPVRIIRFLDEWIKEENQRQVFWGIEGRDWQKDSSGVPYRTQAQRDNWINQNWKDANRAELWHGMAPKMEGSFSDGYPTDLNDTLAERAGSMRPEDKELFEAYGVNGFAQMMSKVPEGNGIWFPTWNMPNLEEGTDGRIALTRCEATMKRLLPQMVRAPTAQFETLWNAYVREMTVTNNIAAYEKGMQKMVDQRIIDRSAGKIIPPKR